MTSALLQYLQELQACEADGCKPRADASITATLNFAFAQAARQPQLQRRSLTSCYVNPCSYQHPAPAFSARRAAVTHGFFLGVPERV
jgi:hypothetical protein